MAGCPADVQDRKDSGGDKGEPQERGEDDGGNTAAVEGSASSVSPPPVTPENGDSDEGCKPEDHGEELDSTNSIFVCGLGVSSWCQDKVRYSEEGPDGSE